MAKAELRRRYRDAMAHLRKVERQRQRYIDEHPDWDEGQFRRDRQYRILDTLYENAERVVENLRSQL